MTSGRECPYYFGRGERDFICPYNMKRVGQRLKRVDETRRDEATRGGQTFGHWTSDVVMETSWVGERGEGGGDGVGRGEMGERAKGYTAGGHYMYIAWREYRDKESNVASV